MFIFFLCSHAGCSCLWVKQKRRSSLWLAVTSQHLQPRSAVKINPRTWECFWSTSFEELTSTRPRPKSNGHDQRLAGCEQGSSGYICSFLRAHCALPAITVLSHFRNFSQLTSLEARTCPVPIQVDTGCLKWCRQPKAKLYTHQKKATRYRQGTWWPGGSSKLTLLRNLSTLNQLHYDKTFWP